MAIILSKKEELEKQAEKFKAMEVSLLMLKSTNTNEVDKLLTQEMMNLSVTDRNDFQEEIHGVKCLAVEESPEMVERALSQLAYVVEKMTPDSEKKAYLQSQQPPKDIPEHQRILQELHQLEPLPRSSYVNDVAFRLRFLRCELFDIRKAAKRMLKFLDVALDLFGDYALRRPIRLSDFSKEELRYMKNGRFQVLPNRDRSGRRILIMLPDVQGCPKRIKTKIAFYQSWAMGYRDVETQRKGMLFILWYNLTNQMQSEKQLYPYNDLKSTRVSAFHLCSPDTPYFRVRRSLAVMRAGPDNRSKIRVHLGEPVELQYALQGYGIPTEDIPISWTGKVKTKNLVQWMRVRHAIEDFDEYNDDSSSPYPQSFSPMSPSGIVECPQPYDILFRKGNAYVSHPGNAKLRAMINDHNDDDIPRRPKQLANELFQERQRLRRANSYFSSNEKASSKIGRYLIWNNQKDWWNEMNDKEQVCLKIEYIIRELRKLSSRESNGRSSKNSCSEGNRKGQKRNTSCATSSSSRTNTVELSSATALFASQDVWSNPDCGGRLGKKQRKQCTLFDVRHDHQNSSGSEDEYTYSERGMMNCFGVGFSDCSI